jgi:ABC-2 type transport system permease protein
LRELHGIRFADFLTPAMATFALLNACYVNMITSVVIAREQGVLKRLNGTPLPLWAYVLGRLAAAAVVGVASVTVVLGVGALFIHVHLDGDRTAALAGVVGLGILVFSALGMAVSTLVPRSDTALPIAYGTMLPIAFISDVFFPATAAPSWLQHVAVAFPLSPITNAAERTFAATGGWPMTRSQLFVTLLWIAGSVVLTAVGFRWQKGTALLRLRSSTRTI